MDNQLDNWRDASISLLELRSFVSHIVMAQKILNENLRFLRYSTVYGLEICDGITDGRLISVKLYKQLPWK